MCFKNDLKEKYFDFLRLINALLKVSQIKGIFQFKQQVWR